MAYTPEKFVADLKSSWKGNFKGAVLYGSAAAGDRHGRYSDYNILLVVRDMSAPVGPAGRHFRRWMEDGNPAPLVMTEAFMRSSADVFPAEWLDMKESHRVLAGDDPLPGITVRTDNLRTEMEREMKATLLRLQGKVRLCEDDRREAQKLLMLSSSTVLSLFRSTLRLFGVSPLPAKREAARAMAGYAWVDTGAFDYIERLRAGDKTALREDPAPRISGYLASIAAVIDRIENNK